MEGKALEELSKEELLALVREKDSQLTQSKEVVADLKQEVAKKQDIKAGVTVKVDKKLYRFICERFTVKQGSVFNEVTAEEAAKDIALCKSLLEKGSGVLVEA